MRLLDVGVLYAACGVAVSMALYRRSDRSRAALASALAAVPLWPLWAPIAWSASDRPLAAPRGVVGRIRAALEEGAASVAATPLARLLNPDAIRSILAEVERVAGRLDELAALLARDDFDLAAAERELEGLERAGATPRARASARLRIENVRRLRELAERDARALEELAGLAAALRTQLVLVRISGSSAEGVGDIVGELWSRIEGLREASDLALPGPAGALETPARA